MPKEKTDHKVHKIAFLVALACVLQISESLIPHPVPGLRLGLANMVTLTALLVLGFRYALEVAILRTLLSSFLMGTFMSPTFLLSFTSAVISTLAMGFLYWLSGIHNRYRFSIIGISIVGAFVHNMLQLYLAYTLLVKHSGIFVFFPWLAIGALGTGWVVGLVAGGVYRKLQEQPVTVDAVQSRSDGEDFVLQNHAPGTSLLHKLGAETKIAAVCAMALLILVFTDYRLYLLLFLVLMILTATSHTPLSFIYERVRKYKYLLGISFALPLFFNSGPTILLTVFSIDITEEGMCSGLCFAVRILLLIVSSNLLMRTTAPAELTAGLARLLSPLNWFGMSSQRLATILSLAWTAIPQLWRTTRQAIFNKGFKRAENMRKLLPRLSELIAGLYLQSEPQHSLWKSDKCREDQQNVCHGSFRDPENKQAAGRLV